MVPAALMTVQRQTFSSRNAFVATNLAVTKFAEVYRHGRWRRFWAKLLRRSVNIQSLQEIERTNVMRKSRYRGIAAIPITQILGSENRSRDFDDRFNPLQSHTEERWVNIARAMLTDQGLPPVELIKIGETYFVRDGHHRISVAKAVGQQAIDAIVIERVVEKKEQKRERCAQNLLDENPDLPLCCKRLQFQESCCHAWP